MDTQTPSEPRERSRVRTQNKKPEMLVKTIMRRIGFRYARKHGPGESRLMAFSSVHGAALDD